MLSTRSTARLALSLAALAGLFLLVGIVYSNQSPNVYNKDFLQDYLLARAAAAGVDPYLPLSTLATRFAVGAGPVVSHPTPHPPPLAVILRPLASLSYQGAALLWLGIELACLVATVAILAVTAEARLSPVVVVAIALAAILWYPVFEELSTAQITLPMLALAAGGQLALVRGRPGLGGALFGLTFLLKPILWLVLPLLVLRRSWRAALTFGGVVAAGYVAAVLAIGDQPIVHYLTRVVPEIATVYRATSRNLSLWSVGWRLFDGTQGTALGIPIPASVGAPPLVQWPEAAPAVGWALALVLLGFLAWGWARQPSLTEALGSAVCASLLLSPTTWDFSLVLLALPLSTGVARLARDGFPRRETALLAAGLAVTAIPDVVLVDVATALGRLPSSGPVVLAAAGPALLTALPAVAVAGLMALMATADSPRTLWHRAATNSVEALDLTERWGTEDTVWDRQPLATASSFPWSSSPRRHLSPPSYLRSPRSGE